MLKNIGCLRFIILLAFLQVCVKGNTQDTTQLDSILQIIPQTPGPKLMSIFDKFEQELAKAPTGKALSAGFQALSHTRNSTLVAPQILAMRNIAKVYDRIGNHEESLRYYQEALTLASNTPDDTFSLALAHFNIGEFLSQQGLLSDGLQHILDAAKFFETLGMHDRVTLCHYQGCMINFTARNYQQCIQEGYRVLTYHQKMLPDDVSNESKFQKMSVLNTIALAYRELRQYDIAIEHYNRAEDIALELNNEFWKGLINGNKAVVLKDQGKNMEAIGSLQADYITSQKYGIWGSAGRSAVSLSEIYTALGNYKKAEQYLDSATMLFARETGTVARQKGMASYWLAYSKFKSATAQYTQAYKALSRHVQLRDSLYQEQESLNLSKVKASYDLDQKQTEIELLTKNNEIQEEHLRSQRIIFIVTLVGLILLTMLVISLIYNYRRQRNITRLVRVQHDEIEVKNTELEAQSTQLQENNQYIQSLNSQLEQKVAERTLALEVANQELDTFLYRSSHDMRRPITTLLGLDLVARHVINDPQANLLFDKVVETARSMDSMLFKMQMMYELNRELLPEPVNMQELLDTLSATFRADIDKYNITYHLSVPGDFSVYANRTLLQIIFRNLIENSINFRKTHPGTSPFVDVHIEHRQNYMSITIADNGIGVEERYQPQIFDLYFRASQASKGNGLGLYLVKKAVQKLGGETQFISDYGMGTTVTVQMPLVS